MRSVDELTKARIKATLELHEALANLAATIDEARDRFETLKRETEEAAHLNLNDEESLP